MTDSLDSYNDSLIPKIVALKKPNEPLTKDIVDYIQDLEQNKICKFHLIDALSELPAALALKPRAFIFCDSNLIINQSNVVDFMNMFKTLIHFTHTDNKIRIAYLVEKITAREYIKEIQKAGIFGIVPSLEYDCDEVTRALTSLLDGIPYWPKHIIENLPSKKEQTRFKDIRLTERQRQVYDLISQRGLSNKQIAQVLKISESTVKIHVSAVMRVLCVRNRTQLALTK
jgi:DNA-binding NarL/FixJ family response regulator